jgi:membrane protease YdiL (CAAX protease family)
VKDRWKQELRGIYSALLFALGIYLIFQSWQIALLFTLSLGIHELGHVLAAWRLGLDWEVGFNALGAWMRTPLEQRRNLDQFANSLIHLAGPLVSLAIAVLTLGIHGVIQWPGGSQLWLHIANFNAILCVLNLLPLGHLSDGGKLVHRLFFSASERLDQTLLAMVGAVPLVAAWIMLTIRLDWERIVTLLIIVLWFALGMMWEREHDDPAGARSPGAMHPRHIGILASILIAGLILSITIALITPFWLTRAEALKMVIDLAAIVYYLRWRSPLVLKVAVAIALALGAFLLGRSIARRLGWDRALSSLLDPGGRLFDLARSGRRLAGWMVALTMSQVFLFIGSIPATVAVIYLAVHNPGFSLNLPLDQIVQLLIGTPQAQVTLLVLGFSPIALLVWAWVAWYERRPFWTLGFERQDALKKLLRGALVGVGSFGAVVAVLALMGSLRGAPRSNLERGVIPAVLPVLMLAAWAVQGSSEEILFRGWLMPTLGARYRPWVGILLSALSFALVHGLNLSLSWLALLNLVLIALFLSLYALWEGGLWGACGFHLAWNWAEGNLFGFHVSGIPPAGGALFHLAADGPAALTGGGFGPEGGLAVTAVLLATIAGLLALARAASGARQPQSSQAG